MVAAAFAALEQLVGPLSLDPHVKAAT